MLRLKEHLDSLEERFEIICSEHEHFISAVENVIDIETYKIKIPHRCPICFGSRFEDSDDGVLCHPCDGTGIVWG